jgi:hypothetical protein
VTAATVGPATTDGTPLGRFEWRSEGSSSLHIDASPDAVYDRIADVTQSGERSLECRGAEWLPGARPGAVGARFRGRNKSGVARWSRVCEVIEAEPGRRFAFRTVPERWDKTRADSTIWGYSIEPEGTGCVVTHDYRIVKWSPIPGFRTLLALLFPHHRDMRPHLAHTLRVLKDELERTAHDGR